MLTFLKRILGLPTPAEQAQAKATESAPYKVEVAQPLVEESPTLSRRQNQPEVAVPLLVEVPVKTAPKIKRVVKPKSAEAKVGTKGKAPTKIVAKTPVKSKVQPKEKAKKVAKPK